MAGCAHCGAKLVEGATTCPACGQRVRERPFVETLPLGSLTEPPSVRGRSGERPEKQTLALGSGIPLGGESLREKSKKPPPDPPGEKPKKRQAPKSIRPIVRPKPPRPALESTSSVPLVPPLSTRLGTPRARLAFGAVLVA
jgi:hypothetical protein